MKGLSCVLGVVGEVVVELGGGGGDHDNRIPTAKTESFETEYE